MLRDKPSLCQDWLALQELRLLDPKLSRHHESGAQQKDLRLFPRMLSLQVPTTPIEQPSDKFPLRARAVNESWTTEDFMIQRNRNTDNLAIEVPLLQYRKRVEQKYTAALQRALA
jgi:hypothetical protein